jgi:hypothetical protein
MLSGMNRPRALNRRAFLGFAAAGIAGAGVAASKLFRSGGSGAEKPVASASRAAAKPRRTAPVPENALPGDPHWQITSPGAPHDVEGYAGQVSVATGESFPLFVSTTSPGFRVTAYRIGWYGGAGARRVWQSGHVPEHVQPAPSLAGPTRTVQTTWEPSLTVPTDDWPAGSYLLRLDADSGAQRFAPVTVRSASTAGKVVLKNGVATWQAYNLWGGYDLYNGPGGIDDYDNRSLAVSLDKPFNENGAPLFLVYELNAIQLAESMDLPLAYVTSMDIAADPQLLSGASALISLGHDEYWTPAERANVTAARDAGVNLAFLGANAMFRRTRLAPTALGENRLVICYRTSYAEDPMYGRDNALVTTDWREPPYPDPESSLTGTLYESNPTTADYVVVTPSSWIFAGTGVAKGTSFAGLVGTEYDRVNPGAPVQRPIQVLAHSPLTCRGINSYSDSAYYTHAGGAGVFNSGTMRWVQAITGGHQYGITPAANQFVKQATSNILRAFADGPAAARYRAVDNLDAMDEYAGDPIAAQHNLW